MEQEYRTPFVDSTKEMLSTMVGASCEMKVSARPPIDNTISGTVSFVGENNGQITLSFPIDTARKVVSEMLGMEEAEMDEETLRDGVGEMANIVAGNVKAALSHTRFKLMLSLPKIQFGPEEVPPGVDPSHDHLCCEFGDFFLTYWLN